MGLITCHEIQIMWNKTIAFNYLLKLSKLIKINLYLCTCVCVCAKFKEKYLRNVVAKTIKMFEMYDILIDWTKNFDLKFWKYRKQNEITRILQCSKFVMWWAFLQKIISSFFLQKSENESICWFSSVAMQNHCST